MTLMERAMIKPSSDLDEDDALLVKLRERVAKVIAPAVALLLKIPFALAARLALLVKGYCAKSLGCLLVAAAWRRRLTNILMRYSA